MNSGNIKRVTMLLKTEEIVFKQICSNISEINQNIFNLIDVEKMGPSEFYKAYRMDEEGYFRMNPEYQGSYLNVCKVYEKQLDILLKQRKAKIEEINGYRSILSQNAQSPITQSPIIVQKQEQENDFSYKGLAYAMKATQENEYTTLNMPNAGQNISTGINVQPSQTPSYEEEQSQKVM